MGIVGEVGFVGFCGQVGLMESVERNCWKTLVDYLGRLIGFMKYAGSDSIFEEYLVIKRRYGCLSNLIE